MRSKRQVNDFAKTLSWWESLYNHLPLTCVIVDESGTIVWLNNWGVSQLGYTAEELRDQPIFNLIDWPDLVNPQDVLNWLNTLQQKPTLSRIDNSCATALVGKTESKSGNLLWFKAIPSPIPQRKSASKSKQGADQVAGRSAKICLICPDVTEELLAGEDRHKCSAELTEPAQKMMLRRSSNSILPM